MESIPSEFKTAVDAAAVPVSISAGGIERKACAVSGIPGADKLPFAALVLLENIVRNVHDHEERARQAHALVSAVLAKEQGEEISFMPARVLFQDFTGVPVFVDFAAMRDAAVERGIDPSLVNPRIPTTLIVDHSVIADVHGCADAAEQNEAIEASRNKERFAFLKWASKSFDNVEIVPPGGGICHQLNIERFCKVVTNDALAEGELACFDTLVGTDSHTTTANGIGVLGWGVGGIEAEAATLGTPISMLVPQVIELRLSGAPAPSVSGMDVALTVAELLRAEGVVGALVEATGEGVQALTPTQRSCIANMTPEYGCTTTLFVVDDATLGYLALTGRDEAELAFAKAYLELQGCYGALSGRVYAKTIELDLASVEPSLAGPSRPHRRVSVSGLKARFEEAALEHGCDLDLVKDVMLANEQVQLAQGAIALAAITSCTTATDAAMMVAAGLVAKAAVEKGLAVKPWVKCVLAPGSHAVAELLDACGLSPYLAELGFHVCGFGCMSCIGNSGPLPSAVHEVAHELELASVLSGNRNFDGRISPDVAQNFLAQPALVVAYALAGSVRKDLTAEPVGFDASGQPVMLDQIMPTAELIESYLARYLDKSVYEKGQQGLFEGSKAWQEIACEESSTFAWDESSTYIRRAPYFELAKAQDAVRIEGARALVSLKDFVTTDHISPAGSIASNSPAARYLMERGVGAADFNTYGARRGNHEVMARGTFANVKLENELSGGVKGPFTVGPEGGEPVAVFDAAMAYEEQGTSLIVLAGKMYGSGSSRDWAAKGPALLGVQAVIAQSFERIHRSNLIQMGVVPLEYVDGQDGVSLGLTGTETFDFEPIDLSGGLPQSPLCHVRAAGEDGVVEFDVKVRVDTPQEGRFLARGGILPYVLDHLA